MLCLTNKEKGGLKVGVYHFLARPDQTEPVWPHKATSRGTRMCDRTSTTSRTCDITKERHLIHYRIQVIGLLSCCKRSLQGPVNSANFFQPLRCMKQHFRLAECGFHHGDCTVYGLNGRFRCRTGHPSSPCAFKAVFQDFFVWTFLKSHSPDRGLHFNLFNNLCSIRPKSIEMV